MTAKQTLWPQGDKPYWPLPVRRRFRLFPRQPLTAIQFHKILPQQNPLALNTSLFLNLRNNPGWHCVVWWEPLGRAARPTSVEDILSRPEGPARQPK